MTDFSKRGMAFAGAVARFVGRRNPEVIVFVALGAVLEGVGILLLVPVLATLFDGSAIGSDVAGQLLTRLAGDGGPVVRLSLLLAAFAVLMILRALVLWRRDTLLGALQIGFVEDQRAMIAKHLADSRWETLAKLGHGRVTHIMSGDIQRCGAGVHFLLQGGVAVVMLVAQIALALMLSPILAVVAIGLMAVGALSIRRLLRDAGEAGSGVTAASLSLMVTLGQFLSGLKMAMSQNLQGAFVQTFEHELGVVARQQTRFVAQQSLMRGIWSLLGFSVAGATMLIAHGLLHLSPPVVIALLVILARLAGPASQLHLGLQQIAYSLPAWEEVSCLVKDLGRTGPAPKDSDRAAPLEGLIVFDDVSYRHGEGADAGGVTGIAMSIEPGSFIGIAGASGAGKTTLADLLAGLIEPTSGRILVGGVPLDDRTRSQWRDQVAYVAQDPVLFNDTVRGNLLWVNPEATDAAIQAALAATGADRLVQSFPAGLETVLGEGGALISGGERQRFALSRALLRSPDLLILDEATSAIDTEGEREILRRLRAMAATATIVLIAHRRESFAACDRILSFDNGRLQADEPRRSGRDGP